MRKIFIIMLFCGLTVSAQKQGKALIDSLFTELPKAKEDSNKVHLLCELSYYNSFTNPDEGLKFGNSALELAEKIKWKKGTAKANNDIGLNCVSKSEFPQALEYYFKALKIFEEIKLKREIAMCLGNIAIVQYYQSDFEKALGSFFKVNKIFDELGDKSAKANSFINIGCVFQLQFNYTKALEYYFKALNLYEELGDQNGMATNFNNIGIIYLSQSDYSNSLDYSYKALELNKKLLNKRGIAGNYGSIGDTYLYMVKDSNKTQLNKLFAGNKTQALSLAKAYLDSSIILYNELGDLNSLIPFYQILSEIHQMLGDNKSALEAFKNYSLAKDSVFNLEKDKKLTQISMQYEFDKKEAANKAEQDKKDIRQSNIRNSITAGLAGALIFLIVVFLQRNRISKAKKRSDELLLNILPEEVAEELKAKGSAAAKQFDNVTVMFTDFKNFTQISEKLSPTELVNEIHECFKAFDHIIANHNIEKIKTIGDSYMCAGGLPVSNKSHADDVVKAAIEIQNFMQQHLMERKNSGKEIFEIRIGIHTGPVVAGIVGVKKFAYDIWGDTVNIASRMESSGEAGKINLSGSTYELVKDKFNCIHRGKIQAKNKGEIDMYFVESTN